LIKKDLSKKDKKDWREFIDNLSNLSNKDSTSENKNNESRRFKFDLHGYSIENANKKINEIINSCYDKGISEILIITGKGIHSKSSENVYVSEDFSKLRNTIPEFIKNNSDLKSKINKIEQADQDLGGSGALLIKLRKVIK
tara:strand:+ start:192 stop:614 length:423 start_codon:yes stop_codon:yes gene_type:complete